MAAKIITVIGSLNQDLVMRTPRIPAGGETLTATSFESGSGGKGANQAVACCRLSRSPFNPNDSDISVKMIGAVGDDDFGNLIVSGLRQDHVDVSGLVIAEGFRSGVAVVLVEENTGENRILVQPGANHVLRPERFTTAEAFGRPTPDLVVLQLEIPLETVLVIIENSKKAGIPILLNPAPAVKLPAEVFTGLDHLILNETEALFLSDRTAVDDDKTEVDWGHITDAFLGKGVKNVVITLGAKGAYVSREAGKGSLVPAEDGVKVVDTTAAGDTFVGAYSVAAARNSSPLWNIEKAVSWACKAAARTVEKNGAQVAIPWADEV